MRSFIDCTHSQTTLAEQCKENEVDRAWHGREEKGVQGFGGKAGANMEGWDQNIYFGDRLGVC
jgi:hypothetical protein